MRGQVLRPRRRAASPQAHRAREHASRGVRVCRGGTRRARKPAALCWLGSWKPAAWVVAVGSAEEIRRLGVCHRGVQREQARRPALRRSMPTDYRCASREWCPSPPTCVTPNQAPHRPAPAPAPASLPPQGTGSARGDEEQRGHGAPGLPSLLQALPFRGPLLTPISLSAPAPKRMRFVLRLLRSANS